MKRDTPEYMHEKTKPSVVWDLIVTDIIARDSYCPGSCIRPLITVRHMPAELEQDTVQVNVLSLFTKAIVLHENCVTSLSL